MGCENRRLEHKVEIFKNPNDACECIIVLYSFSIDKEKIDQIVSMVLNKLENKHIENFQSASIKVRLMQEAVVTGGMGLTEIKGARKFLTGIFSKGCTFLKF